MGVHRLGFIHRPSGGGGGGGTFDIVTDWEGTGFPSAWTNNNGTSSDPDHTTDSRSGTQSLFIGGNDSSNPVDYAVWAPAETSGGVQIDFAEMWVLEFSSSNGGGWAVIDGNGDDVCGWASSNPDWEIWDANGWSSADDNGGAESGVWLRVRITFDWVAGTFDVTIEKPSTSETFNAAVDRPLRSTQGVETLAIRSFGTTSRGWNGGESSTNAYDDVRMVKT